MNSIYPSKNFLRDAMKAIHRGDIIEISIKGWRARMLRKEVESWVPAREAAEIGGGLFKAPSIICNLSMFSLVVIYYSAVSGNYEMHSKVNGSSVILTYVPKT